MPSRSLPPLPSLAQLKLQAKELHRAHAEGSLSAASRIAGHHPRLKARPATSILEQPLALADAQLVLAREYGFGSWAQLKHSVETTRRVAALRPHPRFDEALRTLDRGDVEALRGLVASNPELVHARTHLEPPYGYFTAATLLHHVAYNPGRVRPDGAGSPSAVVDAARLLLDAGAEVDARPLGPNGGTTMGLLITSKQASDLGLSGPLLDLLLAYGASLELTAPAALDAPLANHARGAAERMIELGAKPDLLAAAALGRMDLLREAFDEAGRPRSRVRRRGRAMGERDAVGLALLYAYVNRHAEAVEFLLEKDGNWNMTGVNNGTALHRAAWNGDLAMVERLVAKGADTSNRDNPFHSTPLSWAQHSKQHEAFEWLRMHCRVDLHDAVCFDLREHVEARLREDPASVDRRLDQWEIPWCTPLHWAAWTHIADVNGRHPLDQGSREELVKRLLDAGADPNAVAGNGMTPLEIAHASEAPGIAALLERHGGKRAADL